jgi:hypothetical protein
MAAVMCWNRRLQDEWNACGGVHQEKVRPLPIESTDELVVFERVLLREWVQRVGAENVLNKSLDPQPIIVIPRPPAETSPLAENPRK